jgi:hypothetical protein
MPKIKDISTFAWEVGVWWQDINPTWQKLSLLMAKKLGPWTFMDVPGQNGFLNVLICLKWWRERIDEESEEWKDVLEDILWVLHQMNR